MIVPLESLTSWDPALCALCGGALRILGALGNLIHYRCRSCGIDFSARADLQKTREAIARACDRSEAIERGE